MAVDGRIFFRTLLRLWQGKLGYDLGFGKVGLKDQAYLLDSLVSIKLAKNADPIFFKRRLQGFQLAFALGKVALGRLFDLKSFLPLQFVSTYLLSSYLSVADYRTK